MHKRDALSPPIVLSAVQLLRKRLLVLAIVVLGVCAFFSASTWPEGQFVHETIEWIGIALIAGCILGRTWSSCYIAGRKDVLLVTVGPYSVCRNPLYFFSIMGAVGVGAQFGNILSAAIAGFIAWLLFELVVVEEEKTLKVAYPGVYDDYCARVPRFFPRLSQWRGDSTIKVDRARVTRTFVDACMFLLAVPVAEFLEYFQGSGLIPVLFRIP